MDCDLGWVSERSRVIQIRREFVWATVSRRPRPRPASETVTDGGSGTLHAVWIRSPLPVSGAESCVVRRFERIHRTHPGALPPLRLASDARPGGEDVERRPEARSILALAATASGGLTERSPTPGFAPSSAVERPRGRTSRWSAVACAKWHRFQAQRMARSFSTFTLPTPLHG
jgi:hypothetical protein